MGVPSNRKDLLWTVQGTPPSVLGDSFVHPFIQPKGPVAPTKKHPKTERGPGVTSSMMDLNLANETAGLLNNPLGSRTQRSFTC